MFSKFRCLRRFRENRKGSISIEFGILASVLIGILFSGMEYGRFILVNQQADKAVAGVGDMVSQYTEMRSEDMKDIFLAASKMLANYEYKGQGILVVSHIHAEQAGKPKITWQEVSSKSFSVASKLGKANETPTLPAGFTMDAGETVVAVETFIKFEPLLFDLVVSGQDIYKIAWYHPRKAEQIAYIRTIDPTIDAKDCSSSQGSGGFACGSQTGGAKSKKSGKSKKSKK